MSGKRIIVLGLAQALGTVLYVALVVLILVGSPSTTESPDVDGQVHEVPRWQLYYYEGDYGDDPGDEYSQQDSADDECNHTGEALPTCLQGHFQYRTARAQ